MRIVPDTNVVISGLLWRGSPRRILDAARDGIFELFTSIELLDELEDVLNRDKFVSRMEAAGVTVRELIVGYAALAWRSCRCNRFFPDERFSNSVLYSGDPSLFIPVRDNDRGDVCFCGKC